MEEPVGVGGGGGRRRALQHWADTQSEAEAEAEKVIGEGEDGREVLRRRLLLPRRTSEDSLDSGSGSGSRSRSISLGPEDATSGNEWAGGVIGGGGGICGEFATLLVFRSVGLIPPIDS